MKIYLAGMNGKDKIIPLVHGEGNANLFSREYDISALYSTSATWGGEIKYNATLPRRTAYDNEVQGRKKSCDETLDGGYP